jgi:protein phosphatase
VSRRLDPARFEAVGYTHIGVLRQSNQDALCECTAKDGSARAFVVADGMGGHAGGETASRLAVETIQQMFAGSSGPIEARLRSAIEAANERIDRAQLSDSQLSGMGTTGVVLGLTPEGAYVANVGDSRAYRLRGGCLQQLSLDHSVVAELERRGFITAEQALVHPRRNEVLRSLGTEAGVEIDLDPVDVAPEDIFLLCSDGLSGVVGDADIALLLAREPLEEAGRALIDAANQRGGPDNITVQLVKAPSE